MLVVLPVVGLSRQATEQQPSIGLMAESLDRIDNPISALLNEMGGTMVTISDTIQLVPTVRDFDIGQSYYYALLTLVPNLSGGVHPTILHGIPALWLMRAVDPMAARNGNPGLGYSLIAEAFLNFGWGGIAALMAALGFALGRITSLSMSATVEPRFLAFAATLIPPMLWYCRSDTSQIVRALGWFCLGPYLVAGMLAISSRTKAVSRVQVPGVVCQ
jgi:hypothetical protein